MGRGVVSGLIWGVLVSIVVLAAVSLSTPLPDRTAPPQASSAPAAPTPPPAAADPTPAATPVNPPAPAAAPQTEVSAPGALAAPPDAAAVPVPDLPQSDQAPVSPPDQSVETAAPAAEAAPQAQATAAAPAPAIADSPAQPEPGSLPEAAAPTLASAADPGAVTTPPSRAEAPATEDQPGDLDTAPPPPATMPAPALDPVDPVDTVPRPPLPQVAPPATDTAAADLLAPSDPALAPEAAAAPQPEAVTEAEAEAELTRPTGALAAHAVPFEADPDQPLLAVVLIDDPASPLDLGILSQISFPVSFAIDPQSPNAGARAATLREAGFEVLIFGAGAIPPRAVAADVEVALEAARRTLPQAVALIDNPASRIQGDRPVLEATVAALGASGHGLVAFPGGLNAAETAARRVGLPVGTAFRLLDDEDQRAPVITRYLDRAAFAAGQEGAVIVVGRTRPDTVTALFSWALGGRAEGVGLAPISAVLRRMTP